jgi:thiol-disulfide isomerase/thioredoxin
MPRSRRLLASCLAAGAVVLTGCSADPAGSSYSFQAEDSPVQVDTPELRASKAAAQIEDCPKSSVEPAGSDERRLPDITLPCLGGGRAVNLSGLGGTPMVINLWAQYCGPCREESPVLQDFHEAAGGDVMVLGVDWQDTKPDWAIEFARGLGLTYPQLADPEAATRAPLNVQALPMTLLVDADGRVVYVEKGQLDDLEQLSDLVNEHLGVSVAQEHS